MKNTKANSTTKPINIWLLAVIFLPLLGMGQMDQPLDSSNLKIAKAAREIISNQSICTLITLDRDGTPRARIMDAFLPEDDFRIWFGTNSKSRKVSQIRNNPRVTIFYTDRKGSAYVMIRGKARLVDNSGEKERRWKEGWEAFYPDKKTYLLIEVSPDWMEVVSYPHNIIGDPTTWQPPRLVFDTTKK